ncbi:hypothetical protein IE81DRAFT_228348 [Ceraceosorus guamensis]|uniref:BZIP domain-containing protein n=1 Tax=Ceraceosorus guamensis TaxID=1522189 RepID=A0A316W8J6_9BASI|nr:hypothetical protein IE81DRAFT_228348 [Ceraceosorus guamensis]PWN45081.1 hypothetical protein IE81DRAFT_228348 [Ceraceosorus guamensis]
MAALDVMPYSPGATPSSSAPWAPLSFDDFLDFPSPGIAPMSPRMAPALSSEPQPAVQGAALEPPSLDLPSTSTAPSVVAPPTSSAPSPPQPPPPGSSPEVLFRYYLAAELRRIGSSADDKIIDKYVAQHYASLSKSKPQQPHSSVRQQAPPAAASPAHAVAQPNAFKEQGSMGMPETSALRVSPVATRRPDDAIGIDPHMVELHQPSERLTASTSQVTDDHVELGNSFAGADASRLPLRGSPRLQRSADDMSEDSEGEEQDDVAPLADDDGVDSKALLQRQLAQIASGKTARSSRAGSAGTVSSSSGLGGEAYDGGAQSFSGHGRSVISAAAMLRPSPEEYQKLSSKEKRQLRNKISARNFRTRRKEHITTLEEQLDNRDAIIDSLRSQVSSLTLANQQLTDEVKVLKTKQISQTDVQRILDVLQRSASTSGTGVVAGSADATSAAAQAQRLGISRTASNSSLVGHANSGDVTMSGSSRPSTPNSPRPPILRRSSPSISGPNTRKDVASTSSAFWGGANSTSSALVAAS